MIFDADPQPWAAILDGNPFRSTATIGGRQVIGLFDRGFVDSSGRGRGELRLEDSQPSFFCRWEDVADVSRAEIVIGPDESYKVASIQRDGAGGVQMLLHRRTKSEDA